MARKIVEVLKIRGYFLIAVLSSIIFGAFYLYTQVIGIVQNLDIWFANIPHLNLVFFIIFTTLFGVTMSFQIYNWRQPKVCAVRTKAKGAGASGSATFIGLLIAQCPACASIGALFLPVSAITFFTEFSLVLNVISVGLLLFVINYLGGFKKIAAPSI